MWRRWARLEWIDKFALTVMTGFLVGIVVLMLSTVLNGCEIDPEHTPTTLPTLVTTTLAGVDHITVPTTTTIVP